MVTTTAEIPVARPMGERRMYTWAAIVAALVVFAGFAPTYYLKGIFGTPALSTLKHVHGLVMTAWFALFIVQVRLVATGNVRLHRKVGAAGAGMAILVLVVGTMLGIASARAGISPVPSVPPLVFLVMPIGEMVVFAALFGAAILMRTRGAYHKRLMLLAFVSMVTPAVARLPFEFVQAGGPPVFFALADAVILGCIAYDTIRNRRLHPAFAAGFVVVVVGQFGRLALSQTAAWMAFARWVAG